MPAWACSPPAPPSAPPLGMSLIELKGVRIKTATWCWSWAASIWSTAPRWWTSSLICRSPRASRRPRRLARRARRRYAGAFRAAGEQQLQQHQARYPQLRRFISECWRKTPVPPIVRRGRRTGLRRLAAGFQRALARRGRSYRSVGARPALNSAASLGDPLALVN